MIYDKTYRRGPLALNYVTNFETQSEKPLLVVFPAVNGSAGLCIASYFYYGGIPNADVIHVVDNFGSFGSYFLAKFQDKDTFSLLISALDGYVNSAKSCGQRVVFAGTSKGGTIALLAASAFSGVECIIGEPQIKLGNFLIGDDGFKNESCRSIAHVIMARTDPSDKDALNDLILDRLRPSLPGWDNDVTCIVGKTSGYYYWHVSHLVAELENFPQARARFNISIRDFDTHNAVIDHFVEEMRIHGFPKLV